MLGSDTGPIIDLSYGLARESRGPFMLVSGLRHAAERQHPTLPSARPDGDRRPARGVLRGAAPFGSASPALGVLRPRAPRQHRRAARLPRDARRARAAAAQSALEPRDLRPLPALGARAGHH